MSRSRDARRKAIRAYLDGKAPCPYLGEPVGFCYHRRKNAKGEWSLCGPDLCPLRKEKL